VIVELRAVPDCPNLDATRELLHTCLAEAGLALTVVERVGEYPSPSVLIDGRDVTGADPHGPALCVLRPPTADQIRTALRTAVTGSGDAGQDVTGTAPTPADLTQGGSSNTDHGHPSESRSSDVPT
jgi:hypothetical protein